MFRGLRIAFSGIDTAEADRYAALAQTLGACPIHGDLTADVDVLIASNGGTAKAVAARANGIPCVRLAWFVDSVAASEVLPFSDGSNVAHKCGPLTGFVVTPTGFDAAAVAELEARVSAAGGVVQAKLDRRTSFLVVAAVDALRSPQKSSNVDSGIDPGGEPAAKAIKAQGDRSHTDRKLDFARKYGIPIVSTSFVCEAILGRIPDMGALAMPRTGRSSGNISIASALPIPLEGSAPEESHQDLERKRSTERQEGGQNASERQPMFAVVQNDELDVPQLALATTAAAAFKAAPTNIFGSASAAVAATTFCRRELHPQQQQQREFLLRNAARQPEERDRKIERRETFDVDEWVAKSLALRRRRERQEGQRWVGRAEHPAVPTAPVAFVTLCSDPELRAVRRGLLVAGVARVSVLTSSVSIAVVGSVGGPAAVRAVRRLLDASAFPTTLVVTPEFIATLERVVVERKAEMQSDRISRVSGVLLSQTAEMEDEDGEVDEIEVGDETAFLIDALLGMAETGTTPNAAAAEPAAAVSAAWRFDFGGTAAVEDEEIVAEEAAAQDRPAEQQQQPPVKRAPFSAVLSASVGTRSVVARESRTGLPTLHSTMQPHNNNSQQADTPWATADRRLRRAVRGSDDVPRHMPATLCAVLPALATCEHGTVTPNRVPVLFSPLFKEDSAKLVGTALAALGGIPVAFGSSEAAAILSSHGNAGDDQRLLVVLVPHEDQRRPWTSSDYQDEAVFAGICVASSLPVVITSDWMSAVFDQAAEAERTPLTSLPPLKACPAFQTPLRRINPNAAPASSATASRFLTEWRYTRHDAGGLEGISVCLAESFAPHSAGTQIPFYTYFAGCVASLGGAVVEAEDFSPDRTSHVVVFPRPGTELSKTDINAARDWIPGTLVIVSAAWLAASVTAGYFVDEAPHVIQ